MHAGVYVHVHKCTCWCTYVCICIRMFVCVVHGMRAMCMCSLLMCVCKFVHVSPPHSSSVVCDPPCDKGVCVANDTCQCPNGYSGPTCSLPGTYIPLALMYTCQYGALLHAYGMTQLILCMVYHCTKAQICILIKYRVCLLACIA